MNLHSNSVVFQTLYPYSWQDKIVLVNPTQWAQMRVMSLSNNYFQRVNGSLLIRDVHNEHSLPNCLFTPLVLEGSEKEPEAWRGTGDKNVTMNQNVTTYSCWDTPSCNSMQFDGYRNSNNGAHRKKGRRQKNNIAKIFFHYKIIHQLNKEERFGCTPPVCNF